MEEFAAPALVQSPRTVRLLATVIGAVYVVPAEQVPATAAAGAEPFVV